METVKIRKPYQRPAIKKHLVQRNDPCPCRSGKKFKNCCQLAARVREQRQVIANREKETQQY